jgi:hypothetical protein
VQRTSVVKMDSRGSFTDGFPLGSFNRGSVYNDTHLRSGAERAVAAAEALVFRESTDDSHGGPKGSSRSQASKGSVGSARKSGVDASSGSPGSPRKSISLADGSPETRKSPSRFSLSDPDKVARRMSKLDIYGPGMKQA